MKRNCKYQFNYVETDAVREFMDTMKKNFTDIEMLSDGIILFSTIIFIYLSFVLFI